MRLLSVIPARGSSKGLPGKNLRPFVGLPLIEHSIRFAKLCPEITRCLVTTDSEDIARAARDAGGETPFLRPADLSHDDTPLWPVLQHALDFAETEEGAPYDLVALLDPTSPTRLPEDLKEALRLLLEQPEALGVVAVAEPDYSPLWHSVYEQDGWMAALSEADSGLACRQQVRKICQISGLLYVWRADFMRRSPSWHNAGKHLMLETPIRRAWSIDTLDQFQRAEALIKAGLITLPWLSQAEL